MGIIEDIAEAILSPLQEFITSALAGFVQQVISPITNFISTQIQNLVSWITSGIQNLLATTITQVSEIYYTITGLGSQIQGAVGNVQSVLSGAIDTLWSNLQSAFETLKSAVRTYIETQFNIMQGILNSVRDVILGSIDTVKNAIIGTVEGIGTVIHNVRETIMSALYGIGETITGGLASVFEAITNLPQMIGNAFRGVWDYVATGLAQIGRWIWDGITGAIGWVTEQLAPMLTQGLAGVWQTITGFFSDMINTIINSFQSILKVFAPADPEQAPMIMLSAVGSAIMFGLTAHGVARAMELIHPLKTMGFGQISGFFAEIGNFAYVGRATFGSMVYSAVTLPCRYYFNAMFRSNIPDIRDLQMMAVKPDITMADFEKYMKYHGFSDSWIDAYKRTMFREPRYFELSYMLEDADVPADWLYVKCRRAGYTSEDARTMVIALSKKLLRHLRNRYISSLVKLYKEGFLDILTLESRIKWLDDLVTEVGTVELMGITETYIGVKIAEERFRLIREICKLEQDYDFRMDMIKMYTEAFRKQQITETEFLTALISIGLDPTRAEYRVRYEKLRLLPKPKIEVPEAVDKEWDRIQKMYVKLYITQFRKDLITANELYENLLSIGISDDLAWVTTALEYTRKYKPGVTPEVMFMPVES